MTGSAVHCMPSTLGSRQVPKGTLRTVSLRPGTVFLADCPARSAIEIIVGKWAVVTLFALSQGPRRHGDLVELIGGVSRKVLTQTLRRLQEHGLVERRVYAEAPPRVEYSLTALGDTLREPIEALTTWARVNGASIATFRESTEPSGTAPEHG